MKTIAVALQKGGTGKTTTTVSVAHALAMAGQRVLAVDLDSQGNLALALGLDPSPGLYNWLNEGRPLHLCLVEARPGLDLIPGDKRTAELKENLTGRRFREQVLRQALEPVREIYDWIFLDCAPSLDVLNIAAMVAADGLIVPVAVDYLATAGLAEHVKSLGELQAMGYGCKLLMVVPTFYDRVTRESTQILTELADHFGMLVTAPIPRTVRLREAPAHGQTIWEYAPASAGAMGYRGVVGRLVNGR